MPEVTLPALYVLARVKGGNKLDIHAVYSDFELAKKEANAISRIVPVQPEQASAWGVYKVQDFTHLKNTPPPDLFAMPAGM